MARRRSSRRRSRRRSGYRSSSYRRAPRRSVSLPAVLLGTILVLALAGVGLFVALRGDVGLSMSGGGSTADRDRFEGIGDISIADSDLSQYWWLSTEVQEVSLSDVAGAELLDGSDESPGGGGTQMVQRVVLPVGITFRADSSELSEEARQSLESVVAEIDSETSGVTVLCHSSSDGEFDSRLRISEARAEALAALIEELIGWEAGSVSRKGLGDAFPIAGVDPESPTGLLMNRRCEILLEL